MKLKFALIKLLFWLFVASTFMATIVRALTPEERTRRDAREQFANNGPLFPLKSPEYKYIRDGHPIPKGVHRQAKIAGKSLDAIFIQQNVAVAIAAVSISKAGYKLALGLIIGQTKKSDVIAKFGPPQAMPLPAALENEDIYTYVGGNPYDVYTYLYFKDGILKKVDWWFLIGSD